MAKLKIVSIVLLVIAGISVVSAALYVSGENQKYQDAQDAVDAADSAYADASATYDATEIYYNQAMSDYDWCVYWCYDEMAVVLGASDLLDAAQTDVNSADLLVTATNMALTDAANSFNSAAAVGGVGAGVISIAAVTVTVLARKKSNLVSSLSEEGVDTSQPNWFCVECGAANELGLFCVDCGASRNRNQKNADESENPQIPDAVEIADKSGE
jgi:hypothetical protein